MSQGPVEYIRPRHVGVLEVGRALQAVGRLRRHRAASERRDFLDTFEWRLFREGMALEATGEGADARLVWRVLRGAELREVRAPAPRFARELPEGAFRDHLEEVVEMRALLPVVSVRTQSELVELLDAEGKVVCRLFFEALTAAGPGSGDERVLHPRVRLAPVKGYDDAAGGARGILEQELGLAPAGADVLEAALAGLSIAPDDHSTKVRVELRPEMPAGEAARLLFRRLLHTLRDNEPGTVADVDSEFLHDFRVAVRRTRSGLGQLKGVLPPGRREKYRRAFAWLGALTTPTRDLDVHLLDLPRYRASLPAPERGDLEPLRAFLEARQRQEQGTLAKALGSRRYRALMQDWGALLEKPWTSLRRAPAASRPIRELADARLKKMFRRALREGGDLNERSPPEGFHELRKTCKKLRYLLEFFQSLYPPGEVRAFVDALKGLQDNLGEYQDLQVQSEALLAFSREMAEEGAAGPPTHLAMGMLVEKLRSRQEQVHREFAEAFRAFSDPANRRRFDGLLNPPAGQEGDGP